MHDRLQNGSKGCHSDSSPDENSMLSVENLTCWSTKRSVDVYLQLSIKHPFKSMVDMWDIILSKPIQSVEKSGKIDMVDLRLTVLLT